MQFRVSYTERRRSSREIWAFLLGTHPRLGAASRVLQLPEAVLQRVVLNLSPAARGSASLPPVAFAPEQVAEFAEAFDLFAERRSDPPVLTADSLFRLMRSLGQTQTGGPEWQDRHAERRVDFQEFLSLM